MADPCNGQLPSTTRREVPMSTDESTTEDLLAALEDGRQGFTKGADRLTDLDAPNLATTFRGYAEQRRGFADELEQMAQRYGDDPDRSGSVTGTLHRGWMAIKDTLTKDTPKSILEVAA